LTCSRRHSENAELLLSKKIIAFADIEFDVSGNPLLPQKPIACDCDSHSERADEVAENVTSYLCLLAPISL
jgi:hypothetical protein